MKVLGSISSSQPVAAISAFQWRGLHEGRKQRGDILSAAVISEPLYLPGGIACGDMPPGKARLSCY